MTAKGKKLRFGGGATVAAFDLTLKVREATVALKVRPASTLTVEQAEWEARLAVETAAAQSGGTLDKAERLGVHFATYIAALGKRAIVEWDLVDENDAAVPCTSETVAQALAADPDFARAFDRFYGIEVARRRDEGNVFAPAPIGISAAGATTASPADQTKRTNGDSAAAATT